ncbi:MAG TPA: hypothetical protein VK501_23735 [Baekduia sp.]|uniref:hypothetical protein n=1 Tax=Baekduia sp. TaxID=2600305 RepID=UPI002C2E45F0|nr:hypothetical protein [Baekduia sp.]HMJ36938.1 hypothetical protein [Baekduia sp.]
MTSRRRGAALLTALGLVALAILWYFRPWFHGLVMFFWTAPLVWLPPVVILGAFLARQWHVRRDIVRRIRAGGRPRALVAVPLVAFLSFVLFASLNGPLVSRALYKSTDYADARTLPAGGTVRLLPKEVAEQIAAGGFNSPTEQLTDFHIVRSKEGLEWTAMRTPDGAFRVFSKKSQGVVALDAEQTARTVRQVDAEFKYAPGVRITDNLRWQLLKRHYLITLGEETAILDDAGQPLIVVPYMKYKGLLIRRPVFGGVFVVHPDGRIEDLMPQEAAARPALVASGRIFPEALARRIQDAYAYKKGLWNAWFVHEEQTHISDTEDNQQPYLIDFGPQRGAKWVTVAEPYGRAFAVNAIFLTDTVTGKTDIWRVPRGQSLTGNRRALETVRSVTIPGVDFASRDQQGGRGGDFRVVEPRPVFVAGRLVYLVSIVPDAANSVSKTVIVDAARNKVTAIFDNDTDPQAEAKTLRYLATGVVPGAAAAEPAPDEQTPAAPSTTAPASGARPSDAEVQRRLDAIIERQRELLRDAQRLRESLGAGGGTPAKTTTTSTP